MDTSLRLPPDAPCALFRLRLRPTTEFAFLSPTVVNLTGYGAEAFFRDPALVFRLIAPPDRHPLRRLLADRTATHGSLALRVRHADGSPRWLEFHVTIDRDPRGRPVAVEGLARDVTGRHQAEEAQGRLETDLQSQQEAEAEKAQLERRFRRGQTLEAVGRLAGGVAHDFNNLLGGVLGALYLARLALPPDAPVLAELAQAQDLCKQGGELTRKLLEVARLTPGRLAPVQVEAVLRDARELLARTLPRTIQIHLVLEPDLPPAWADRATLTAAFLNLGLNARDAMPTGGDLTLSARRGQGETEGDTVVIEVADSGAGIAEELQDLVFEPFFTTKPKGQGTGLGLSMVHAGIQEFGGDLAVRSNPECGVTFTIRLPAAPAATPPLPGGSTTAHPVTAAVILVVEDEAPVAASLGSALAAAGYRHQTAATGLEALEVVRDLREDLGLIALDLGLPGLGGAEVFRLLERLAPEIPVLFITGRPDLARGLDPATPLLAKPFTPEEFLAAVGARLAGPVVQ